MSSLFSFQEEVPLYSKLTYFINKNASSSNNKNTPDLFHRSVHCLKFSWQNCFESLKATEYVKYLKENGGDEKYTSAILSTMEKQNITSVLFHKLYLPYQVSVWLTTEITCSCLLAVQLSTSQNGRISIPSPFRVPVMAARSASVPEPTKLVPGERGVLDLDNASGCNNQAYHFLALCRPFWHWFSYAHDPLDQKNKLSQIRVGEEFTHDWCLGMKMYC